MSDFISVLPTNYLLLAVAVLAAAGYFLWKRFGSKVGTSGTLAAYTRDLTEDARAGKLGMVIGREAEIERLVHILSRKTKNNPILLGAPGVGKTALVEGLALRIASSDVPEGLIDKQILALDLGGMISGTKYRGEFEERIKNLLDEILALKRQVILFIDEVHMIVQAKGSEGAINVSDILKPALARGDLRAIGATTSEEYQRFIRPDDALDRRFQPLQVGEPTADQALRIIRGIKAAYEKHHHVRFDDSALLAAVDLSTRFIADRFLPDKAIDLIDEAGAKVGIEYARRVRQAAGLLHAAAGEKTEGSAAAQAADDAKTLAHDRELVDMELEHLKKLEATLTGDAEVSDARHKMEQAAADIAELAEEGVPKGVPAVTAEDIRTVVSEWTGVSKDQLA